MVSTALVRTDGDALAQAATWATMADDERRRRAAEACNRHDAAALAGLADAYLTLHGKAGAAVSRYTRRNYSAGICVLVEAWREENLLRPRRDAAHLWLRQMEASGKKPGTLQVTLAGARMLYRALRWAGATEADPFRDARPAKDPTPAHERRRPYPDADLAALAAAASPSDRVLVLLAGFGGLRAAELCDLRWGDVDLPGRTLVVVSGKGRKKRQLALGRSLVAALQAVHTNAVHPDGYVLPYRTTMQARNHMRALCERCGVPYLGIHAARHTAGTRLVRQSGGNLELARDLLGHASIATTQVYSHWSQDKVREATEDW